MTKVQRDRLGTAAPKVTWGDLEEDVTLVTIADYEEGEVDDAEKEDGVRKTAFLTFDELGDKRLYLNVTQVDFLIEAFGDNSEDWIGKKVPLEKTKKRFGKVTYEKIWIVPFSEWDDYMETKPRVRRKKVAGGRRKKKKARRA